MRKFMTRQIISVAALSLLSPVSVTGAELAAKLDLALNGAHREAANVARDVYRHPRETMLFFDLREDMRVLEILPGRGWYTEVLAPLFPAPGALTVASFGDDARDYLRNIHLDFVKKLAAAPEVYGGIKVVKFNDAEGYLSEVEDASMDAVLTFRNTHNWIRFGGIEEIYAAFYRVLKPQGILGVVQHRAAAGSDAALTAEKGYVPEKTVIQVAEQAGFELVDRSEINANPRDSRDHPEGVWSLPPSYREKDKNRDKYSAIGESDRMTLRFVKL